METARGQVQYVELDLSRFRGRVPTLENLAIVIWDLLAPKLGTERLWQLRVWEDPTLWVDYRGDTEAHGCSS